MWVTYLHSQVSYQSALALPRPPTCARSPPAPFSCLPSQAYLRSLFEHAGPSHLCLPSCSPCHVSQTFALFSVDMFSAELFLLLYLAFSNGFSLYPYVARSRPVFVSSTKLGIAHTCTFHSDASQLVAQKDGFQPRTEPHEPLQRGSSFVFVFSSATR